MVSLEKGTIGIAKNQISPSLVYEYTINFGLVKPIIAHNPRIVCQEAHIVQLVLSIPLSRIGKVQPV
jgi:hypothetical protein